MLGRIKKLKHHWPALAALVSAAMLAMAHAFEHFGHMAPCELCLKQRAVYWVALALGLVIFAAWRFLKIPAILRGGIMLLGLTFLTGMLIAGYHAGVEWHFWPGPKTCTGGAGGDIAAMGKDLLDAISKPAQVPQCDQPPFVLFGISMAGYNTLLSAFLAAFSFWLVWPQHQEKREL